MRRVAELDGLRGLSALLIAIYHLRPQDLPFGWPRVDIFFVLSGFLITSIILRHGASHGFLSTFFARRALRTWPLYFLTLFSLVALNPLLPGPPRLDGLPYFLTFTQNLPRYWSDSLPPFNLYFLHTWSLAVEEQFYLVWPVLVLGAGRRRLAPLCLLIVAISVSSRVVGFHPWLLIARADALALGGLLAALFSDREFVERHHRSLSRASLACGLGALAYLLAGMAAFGSDAFTRPEIVWPGVTILATSLLDFALVGLILCHSGHPALGFLRGRSLARLGSISYGLFVLHPLVFAATTVAYHHLGAGEPAWLDLVKLPASLVVASLSRTWIEGPILSLRDRLPFRPPLRLASPSRA